MVIENAATSRSKGLARLSRGDFEGRERVQAS